MVATESTPCPDGTAPGSTLPGDPAPEYQPAQAGHGDRIPPVVYLLGRSGRR